MTCKDCLHYDACRDAEGMDESCLTTDVEYEDMTKWCHCFKNKADFEEVKHGEWLMCLSDEPWRKGYHGRCSECGAFYTYNINKMPRRCDNCDAKMDGGKDINVPTKQKNDFKEI